MLTQHKATLLLAECKPARLVARLKKVCTEEFANLTQTFVTRY